MHRRDQCVIRSPLSGRSPVRLKVLIAEDSPEIGERLCRLLETDHEVVGLITDGMEVLQAANRRRPDILLLDISLPNLSGFTIARRLRDSQSAIKILFVSLRFDHAYVNEAKSIGAAGFVYKSRLRTDLLPAMQAVGEGGLFFSSQL
jgi:DNA-binding NarL/FixJ family response regulator